MSWWPEITVAAIDLAIIAAVFWFLTWGKR